MLMLLLLFCAAYVGIIGLPRLAVGSIALIIAVCLSRSASRTTPRLLEHQHNVLDYDRKPTGAQRRQMRAGLQLALHQTELRSLFPALMAWVDARAA